jgi:glycine hydroxymethyltransferase
VTATSESSVTFPAVRAHDPQVADLLRAEQRRQSDELTLIASENHCSPAVREACSSVLSDKYAEGYPGARYYGGCEVADQVEDIARERARRLFGAAHANVQPHSGTTANLAVLETLAGARGRILGMALSDGGHLSHGHKVSATGKLFEPRQYGVDHETGLLRYEEIRAIAKEFQPSVLICGASSYPREIDYAAFAAIAKEVGAVLLADIAHPAGLIAAGVIGSPIPHADVVTMTTHKTLRGPRGGMVLCTEALAKKIDGAVFPGGQGGPLMHQIAAKAVAFGEALGDPYRSYARAVRDNAVHLAACLVERGLRVVTGGTDTHMVVVDLRGHELSGADVEARCRIANLAINKNMVPGDPRSPRQTSGIRVGTAAATTRGLGTAEFEQIAEVLAGIVHGDDPETFRSRISDLCGRHPLP